MTTTHKMVCNVCGRTFTAKIHTDESTGQSAYIDDNDGHCPECGAECDPAYQLTQADIMAEIYDRHPAEVQQEMFHSVMSHFKV